MAIGISSLGGRGNTGINGGRMGWVPDGQGGFTPNPMPAPPEYTPQAAYPRAIEQQAGDYSRIMEGWGRAANTPNPEYGNLMSRYNQLWNQQQGPAAQHTYGETAQFNEAFGNARGMAEHGGINAAEEASMRSRGVSPIRAAYQNATREMNRQSRLGGGSANYNAAISRMARQQGQSMADAMENVNAGIAETRQRGRMAGTEAMTRMGEGSSSRMNEVGMFNANARNRQAENQAGILAGMGNIMNAESNRRAQALQGMTSLYGTTPALVNTFGNQVQNAQQMAAANPRTRRPSAPGAAMMMRPSYGGGVGF